MPQYVKNKYELGQNIKKYRESKNFTQAKLAQLLCINRSMISYYERGRCFPSPITLFEMSKLFEINLEDFFIND